MFVYSIENFDRFKKKLDTSIKKFHLNICRELYINYWFN